MAKKISLVLGSGGARGMAHIGVIRYLEENDFEIAAISGCSIGAVIGGVYALGKLPEFEAWLSSMAPRDIINLMDFTLGDTGLVKGEKIMGVLETMIGGALIEDLPIRYTAVATNIEEEKEVWINTGPLMKAIRATSSIPVLFTPVSYGRGDLIDGGVLNPVPIAPTFGDATDMTIAVNLSGPPMVIVEKENVDSSQEQKQFLTRAFNAVQNLKHNAIKSLVSDWALYEVASKAFDTMQGAIARQKLAAYPPDALVEIPRNACAMLDFNRTPEIIELGYRMASEQLKGLE
jgi:NTE family protein